MSERITRHQMFMEIAGILGKRGTCSRAAVGAVVTKDNRIVSTGYVGSPTGMPHCIDVGCEIGPTGGCERTVHAEANAIAFAAKHGISMDGATMYCTHAPCYTCAKLVINSGVKEFIFHHWYREDRGLILLIRAGVEVYIWNSYQEEAYRVYEEDGKIGRHLEGTTKP